VTDGPGVRDRHFAETRRAPGDPEGRDKPANPGIKQFPASSGHRSAHEGHENALRNTLHQSPPCFAGTFQGQENEETAGQLPDLRFPRSCLRGSNPRPTYYEATRDSSLPPEAGTQQLSDMHKLRQPRTTGPK
jgi:hypothetical protein